jgi:hypothetical protein
LRHPLGRAYRDAGRLTTALPLLERVVAEMESELGTEHPTTVEARKDLEIARELARKEANALGPG